MKCYFNQKVLTFLFYILIYFREIDCHHITLKKLNISQDTESKSTFKREVKHKDPFKSLVNSSKDAKHKVLTNQANKGFSNEVIPVWKYLKTTSFYEEFEPIGGIDVNSYVIKNNKNNIQIFDAKITKKTENCVHTVQNEIAMLFNDELDIAKSIFPMCCKNQTKIQPKGTTCISISKSKPSLYYSTNKKPTPNSKYYKTLRKVSIDPITTFRQTQYKSAEALRASPNVLISSKTTNIYNHISNEAVVNVVIHVKCEHPEFNTHVLPNTVSITTPLNFNEKETLVKLQPTKNQILLNFANVGTTNMKSSLNFPGTVNETDLIKCVKQTLLESNLPESSKEQDEILEKKVLNDDQTIVPPQPFLPRDITIHTTNPPENKKNFAPPLFICQLTQQSVKTNATTSSTTSTSNSLEQSNENISSKKRIWPHFWRRAKSSPQIENTTTPSTFQTLTPTKNCSKTLESTELVTFCDTTSPIKKFDSPLEISGIANRNNSQYVLATHDEPLTQCEDMDGSFPTQNANTFSPSSNQECFTSIPVPEIEDSSFLTETTNNSKTELNSTFVLNSLSVISEQIPSCINQHRHGLESTIQNTNYNSSPISLEATSSQYSSFVNEISSPATTLEQSTTIFVVKNTRDKDHNATPAFKDIENEEDVFFSKDKVFETSDFTEANTIHELTEQAYQTTTLLINQPTELQETDAKINTSDENVISEIMKLFTGSLPLPNITDSQDVQSISVTTLKFNEPKSSFFLDSSSIIPEQISSSLGIQSLTKNNDYRTFPIDVFPSTVLSLETETSSTASTSDYTTKSFFIKGTRDEEDNAIPVLKDNENKEGVFYPKDMVIATSVSTRADTIPELTKEQVFQTTFLIDQLTEQRQSSTTMINTTTENISDVTTLFTDRSSSSMPNITDSQDVQSTSVFTITFSEPNSTLLLDSSSTVPEQVSSYLPSWFESLTEKNYYRTSQNNIFPSEVSSLKTETRSTAMISEKSTKPFSIKGTREEEDNANPVLKEMENKEGVFFPKDMVIATSDFTVGDTIHESTTDQMATLSITELQTSTAMTSNGNENIFSEPTKLFTDISSTSLDNVIDLQEVQNIVDLKYGSFMFYYKSKWYTSNNDRLWAFDGSTLETMNYTFFRVAEDHSADNNKENKKFITSILETKGSFITSEKIPFEVFARTILQSINYIAENANIEWSGLQMSKYDIVAMLRLTGFDSSFEFEWGTVNWVNIFNQLLESTKTMKAGKYEYSFSNREILTVFSNGTSIWKNKILDLQEALNTIGRLNWKTTFSSKTIYSSFTSDNVSFVSFMKHIFQQRMGSNTTYSEYVWGKSTYSWEEILALLRITNPNLININDLENSINQYTWDDQLIRLRNSEKHYFVDRTVYYVNIGSRTTNMTVFVNGTTQFNGETVTLNALNKKMDQLPSVEDSDINIRHITILGGGKYQFYWRGKWFVTDQIHVWAFEDTTSRLMNQTFFKIPEITTVSLNFTKRLLENRLYQYFEMPFEIFSQSILKTASYKTNYSYKWGSYVISYTDIIAMLRLSNINEISLKIPDNNWGQNDWHIVYEKVKQSPSLITVEKQTYEMTDFDGKTYRMVVFSNGTSIWKDTKVSLEEILSAVEVLNGNLQISESFTSSSYVMTSGTFESFLNSAIINTVKYKSVHNYYIWKNYQFKWEDLEVIHRVLLYYYKLKTTEHISLSKIVLPILYSSKTFYPNKVVFEIKFGSALKPLVLYKNGTSIFEGTKLDFADAITQFEESKKRSGLVLEEDLELISTFPNAVNGLTKSKIIEELHENTHYVSSSENHISNNLIITEKVTSSVGIKFSGLLEKYDWKFIGEFEVPLEVNKVYYPINLGGGIYQFYMNNAWYLTNGIFVWKIRGSSTEGTIKNAINIQVKWLNSEDVPDDHRMSVSSIQKLIYGQSFRDFLGELALPYELIIHHSLFFMKYRKSESLRLTYHHSNADKDSTNVRSDNIILYLRLAAFDNFTTTSVHIPWENNRKPNWKWVRHAAWYSFETETATGQTYQFRNSELENKPPLTIYSNGSSTWESQQLDIDEALIKVQHANERSTFLPFVVDDTFSVENSSAPFESLYKEALRSRFERNLIHTKYKWLKIEFRAQSSFPWLNILIYIRFLELYPENDHNDEFWMRVVDAVDDAEQKIHFDRVEYGVKHFKTQETINVVVFMNESTLVKGKEMSLDDYRSFYKEK